MLFPLWCCRPFRPSVWLPCASCQHKRSLAWFIFPTAQGWPLAPSWQPASPVHPDTPQQRQGCGGVAASSARHSSQIQQGDFSRSSQSLTGGFTWSFNNYQGKEKQINLSESRSPYSQTHSSQTMR